jgi:hypothetical protein
LLPGRLSGVIYLHSIGKTSGFTIQQFQAASHLALRILQPDEMMAASSRAYANLQRHRVTLIAF